MVILRVRIDLVCSKNDAEYDPPITHAKLMTNILKLPYVATSNGSVVGANARAVVKERS
jgi:hypothetical protein